MGRCKCTPFLVGPRRNRGHVVGQYESADPRACGGLRGLLNGGVIVQDVLQSLARHQPDQILANDCLHVGIGSLAQRIERCARNAVTTEHHRVAAVVEAEGNGGLYRTMIGCANDDRHRTDAELVAGHDFGDLHHRRLVEVGVMVDAVLDVGCQRCQRRVYVLSYARWTVDAQRHRHRRHHPVHGEHVVEVGEVITVQMGHQYSAEHGWYRPCGDHAHEHTAPTIDEHRRACGAHERGWPGTPWVGNRVAGTEQGDLHVGNHINCHSI